jgi:hypothetical protein
MHPTLILSHVRVRCARIFYYPDGSVEITEPWEENTGLPQGYLMRRQVPLKADGSYYMPSDFQCGRDMYFDDRMYRVVSASKATKAYFHCAGLNIGVDEPVPLDAHAMRRKEARDFAAQPTSLYVTKEKTLTHVRNGGVELDRGCKQFLQHDQHVLRFFAYWDDPTEFGTRRFYRVHFYLADHTTEIIEDIPETRNCAASSYIFLERSILPHGTVRPLIRDHLDRLSQDRMRVEDFKVGSNFHALSREFHVYDCDKFTRQYFLSDLGIDLPLGEKNVRSPSPVLPRRAIPPPTGYGSEADSLLSCTGSLVLVAPLSHDSPISDVVLRFSAKMFRPRRPEDSVREFVLGFYPSDESIVVWEVPVKNSGYMKMGKFAQRGKKTNPTTGSHYTLNEIVKMTDPVVVFSTPFVLVEMDEFTKHWLKEQKII